MRATVISIAAAILLALSSSSPIAEECQWPVRKIIRFYDYAEANNLQGKAGIFRMEFETGLQIATNKLRSLGFDDKGELASVPKYSTNPAELFLPGSLTVKEGQFQIGNDPSLLLLLDGAVLDDTTVLSRLYLDLQRYDPALEPDPFTDNFKLNDEGYTELSGINIVATYIALASAVKHDVKTPECRLLAGLLLDKSGEILNTLKARPNPSSSIDRLIATIAAIKAAP